METRPAEFFVGTRRDLFDLTPWNVDKAFGEIAEVNGRLVGICTDYLGRDEIVYDIESGLSLASIAREDFNSASLHDCVEDFDKYLALGGEGAELAKNFTEAIQAAYDANPDMKRKVFGN